MSNKYSVTVYRNNIFTKDGAREVFRVKSWDAVPTSSGEMSFKLKLNAAMSVNKGVLDNFQWQAITNAEGVITGHKAKALVYGKIASDKTGSLWLNPFMAISKGERQWELVDPRTAPESARPMVFELGPWEERKENTEVADEVPQVIVVDEFPF